ncbi:hypothetical protein ACQ4PT_031071 [Festuca glaucescens]
MGEEAKAAGIRMYSYTTLEAHEAAKSMRNKATNERHRRGSITTSPIWDSSAENLTASGVSISSVGFDYHLAENLTASAVTKRASWSDVGRMWPRARKRAAVPASTSVDSMAQRLDDDIWDIKFNFPGQDNLERKLSRSDITVLNLLSLIESYGYGIRDNMYYVKEKGRGVEGMELIDSMGKIVEMLALNEAEHGAIITVLKKNSVWPAGFNMEADEAEVLDVPVKFSVDNNGVNYISENEEFVPVAIDLTDVLYVGTQQSCNVPKGMQVPIDIMSDDEDAFFYPCQYNLEERNRLVAEEYELMHKLKRQKKEKEPDEEVVQIMHKLDEERKRRSNPAMHYEGDTDVEEIYEEEEEESDGDEAPELEYFEKEYSFEKKQPLNPGPTSRSHYETLEYQCEDFVPSSDEDNSPGDVGDSDDDGFTKKHKLPCGRKRKLKKLKKRVWYDPHRADAHLQFCKKLCFKDVYEFRVALRNYHIAQLRNFAYHRNTPTSIIVTCTAKGKDKGCKFYLTASEIAHESTFCLRKYGTQHTCIPHGEKTLVSIDWLAGQAVHTVRTDPNTCVDTIIENTKLKFGVEVPRSKAYRARKKAFDVVMGDQKAQYTRLRDYLQAILDTNPG